MLSGSSSGYYSASYQPMLILKQNNSNQSYQQKMSGIYVYTTPDQDNYQLFVGNARGPSNYNCMCFNMTTFSSSSGYRIPFAEASRETVYTKTPCCNLDTNQTVLSSYSYSFIVCANGVVSSNNAISYG